MPIFLVHKGKAKLSFVRCGHTVAVHLITQEALYVRYFESLEEAVSFVALECAFLCGEEANEALADSRNLKWAKLLPAPEGRALHAWGFSEV
jgi:hypothetical protein